MLKLVHASYRLPVFVLFCLVFVPGLAQSQQAQKKVQGYLGVSFEATGAFTASGKASIGISGNYDLDSLGGSLPSTMRAERPLESRILLSKSLTTILAGYCRHRAIQ